MSTKKLKSVALLAVLAIVLVLACALVACNPKECKHENLSELVEAKAATCVEKGVVAHYHCNDCGKDLAEDKMTVLDSTEIAINPNAHDFDVLINEVPATCSAAGTKAHKDCKLCHKHFDESGKEIPEAELTIEKDENAHNFGTLIAGKAATCQAKGEAAHYHCDLCNKDIAEDKKTILETTELDVNPNAHDFDVLVNEVPATCSAAGTKAHKDCKLCHKHFDESGVEIPEAELTIEKDENAHNFGTLIAEKKATCSAKGVKAHYHCDLCNKDIDTDKKTILASTETEIDQNNHDYGSWIQQKDADCVNDGEKAHYECQGCHKKFDFNHDVQTDEQLKIAAEGHNYELKPIEGQNKHHEICSKCGDVKEGTEKEHSVKGCKQIDQLNHENYCECGYTYEQERHTVQYLTNEQYHYSYCDVCKYEWSKISHTLEMRSDGTQHYMQCTANFNGTNRPCNYIQESSKAACSTTGEWQQSEDKQKHFKVCDICKNHFSEAEHITTNYTYKGKDGHKWTCTTCQYKSELISHNMKPSEDGTKDVCELCKYEETKECEHSWTIFREKEPASADVHIAECDKCHITQEKPHEYAALNNGWYEGDGTCLHCHALVLFTLDSTHEIIANYTGTFAKVKFPTTIQTKSGGEDVTYTIKSIGTANNRGKGAINSEYLTHAIISVDVNDATFMNNTALQEVKMIAGTLTGANVFYKCSSLQKLTIPASAINSKYSFVAECSNLQSILITGAKELTTALNKSTFNKLSDTLKIYLDCAVDEINVNVVFASVFSGVLETTKSKLYFYYASSPDEGQKSELTNYGGAWHYDGSEDIDHISIYE